MAGPEGESLNLVNLEPHLRTMCISISPVRSSLSSPYHPHPRIQKLPWKSGLSYCFLASNIEVALSQNHQWIIWTLCRLFSSSNIICKYGEIEDLAGCK